MTVVIEADEATAERLAKAAGTPVVHRTSLVSLPELLLADSAHDVLLLGPSVPLQPALDLAENLRVTSPTTGVVVVRTHLDRAVLPDAMRAGVRDVLSVSDTGGIKDAVTRLQSLAAAIRGNQGPVMSSNGRLVTVFSAKGGCGKTTIATNLAAMIASHEIGRVALVDLDLAFGDVAISLQLFPSHTIGDAVMMSESLDTEGLDKLLTQHSSGVDVLAAPVSPEIKESISPILLGRVLDLLKQNYDYVIVDSAPSFDEQVLAALDRTDLLVLLATPDIPALKNLKVALETLKLLRFPEARARLLVNRSDAEVGLTLRDIERTAGIAIDGTVPASSDVPAATNRGHVITLSDPEHQVTLALQTFLREVVLADVDTSAVFADASGGKTRRRFLRLGTRAS